MEKRTQLKELQESLKAKIEMIKTETDKGKR